MFPKLALYITKKDNLSFGEIIAFVSLNNDETKNFNHSIMQ